MAMALAVIMIALLSAMGAGLLVFASTDLGVVVESNKGQRAFEMADAGVKAAKQLLTSHQAFGLYDDGVGDSQWSWKVSNTSCASLGVKGMCLNDLDGDGTPTDSVNVTVQSVDLEAPSGFDSFKVVSTGGYGDAKRRIEAVFKARPGTGGIPAYYTPGDIVFKEPTGSVAHDDGTKIKGLSFFSGRNILIQQLAGFSTSDLNARVDPPGPPPPGTYKRNNFDVDTGAGSKDTQLGDWKTSDDTPPANWNTNGRKAKNDVDAYDLSGFAAEGFICKGISGCTSSTDSIADGLQGYDSTTGTGGTKGIYKFVSKTPPDSPNASGTITYPFPRLAPDTDYLKGLAEDSSTGNKYFIQPPALSEWQSAYSTLPPSTVKPYRVVFVDLENSLSKDVIFGEKGVNPAPNTNKGGINTGEHGADRAFGILVVRCGNLTLRDSFTGVIILLRGTGSDCEATGHFKNRGYDEHLSGYVYAEGYRDTSGNPQAGIEIAEHIHMEDIPDSAAGVSSGYADNLLNLAYGGSATGGVDLLSWREVYN